MPFDQEGYAPAPSKTPSHPSPTSSPVMRNLTKGRARIESPHNWSHVGAGDGHDTFCTVMAIQSYHAATYQLLAAPLEGLDAPVTRLINFNEAPTTTHADVLALFDRAIATAKAQS